MLDFPNAPSVGQQFQSWIWDGVKWSAALNTTLAPDCGLFQIVGASPSQSVQFVPRKGNLIKINGLIYQIPASGISATANNCTIDGVTGQLAAATFYYVYAWQSGGGLALDFSKTGYEPSPTAGNVGIARKIGDDTRSLVGLVYTSSSAPSSNSFYDSPAFRTVRSWFNRTSNPMFGAFQGNATTALNATSLVCVAFANENLLSSIGCWFSSPDSQPVGYISTFVDGVQKTQTSMWVWQTGIYTGTGAMWTQPVTDGVHTVNAQTSPSAGTLSFACTHIVWLN